MAFVSIIVPCYNEEKTIALLLDAIYYQTYPRDQLEVIISDGQSNDQTRVVVSNYQDSHRDLRINLVENTQKTIPAALNAAIAAASGEYIVRMDAHSVPSADYVERCVASLEADLGDNVGGVWDIQPGGKGWIARSIAAAAAHPLGVGDALYRYTKQAGEVDTVPFGSFRRSLLEKIGFFDETLLTNEDYEFNTRIHHSGGRVWLDPEIRTIYFARSSLGALAKQYWRYGYWKWKMLQRYPGTLRWRQALPPLFVLGLICLLAAALIWPWTALLLGFSVLVYLLILEIGAIPVALRQRDSLMILGIPAAIAVMHLCWGGGFLYSLANKV